MKRIYTLLTMLLLVCAGAWAETVTWTSGVSFNESTTGNYSTGWFSVTSPFSGTINTFTVNLGTGGGGGINRTDAYLAISRDLKSTTTGFSSSDFIAISTNKCGTSGCKIDMLFDNAELDGGSIYYFYWVTEVDGVYTTVYQRYYVVSSTLMSVGNVGATTSSSTAYAMPFTSTMTLNTGKYYRMKAIMPTDLTDCYICSNSTNEDKLWKTTTVPSIADTRSVWKATIDGGVILQNMGSDRYVSKLSAGSNSGNSVNYLSATNVEDAEAFTLGDRSSFGRSKAGYVTLKANSQTSSWLNTFTKSNNYVGSHNVSPENGDPFLFLQVKKVSFVDESSAAKPVEVNGGEAVSVIYVAVDGSDNLVLPSKYLYSINGGGAVPASEASTSIVSTGNSDMVVTVSDNPTTNVTYKLNWSDGSEILSESDVETNISGSASEFVPSSFLNDFVSLSYSPATISSETTEVTVTATWNGPFEISPALSEGNFASGTKWYVVDIHSNAGDYTWQYDASSQEIQTPVIAKDAYDGLTDANLWCFIGNPYDGLKIYNKAAGSTYTLRKENNGNTVSYMSTTDDRNNFKVYASTSSISSSYCFKLDGDTYYLNQQTNSGVNKLCGWDARDEGSSCRFLPPGKYYLNFIDGLCLDAPLGAVGTNEYFVNHPEAVSIINSLRSTIESAQYSDITTLSTVNVQLDPVKNSATIALANGYYRIVSACTYFTTKPALYFNSTNGTVRWSKDVTANNLINSIFAFSGSGTSWTLYSPNAQKYIAATTGTLNESEATVTVTSLGAAMFTLKVGSGNPMHPNGHWQGSGNEGNIIAYQNEAGTNTSAWYILPVGKYDITMNAVGDGNYYATGYWPFDVTITGATAYTLNVDGEWAVPTAVPSNQVPAGTAVLLKGTAAIATATLNTDDSFGPAIDNVLSGVYVNTDADGANDYFLGRFYDEGSSSYQVGFYHWSGTTLAANRAYLPASAVIAAGARGFAINWDDEVTGIGDATQLKQKAESRKQVFDLQGRRVENPQRGLYIVNGRKVVVK